MRSSVRTTAQYAAQYARTTKCEKRPAQNHRVTTVPRSAGAGDPGEGRARRQLREAAGTSRRQRRPEAMTYS